MKKYIAAAILAFIAVVAQAATVYPSKNYVTRTLKIGAFTALRTNTSIDIEYTVGPQSVKLYVPDNIADYVKVTLADGELKVSYTEDMQIMGSHKTRLIVSAPDVVRFTTASAGDINIKSNISQKNKNVELTVLSAGDIDALNINANKITLQTSSAGDIEVNDLSAASIELYSNSAGDIEAHDIKATYNIQLYVNSAGDIDVNKAYSGNTLRAYDNSAGDIDITVASAEEVSTFATSYGDIKISTVEATSVEAAANSIGNVTLGGIADKATFEATSHGSINAKGLKAISITAKNSGLGNITCYPLQLLDATRLSVGKILYANTPTNLIKTESRRDSGINHL